MSCFTDLIGIKGECGTPTSPDSGLYIQDLSGISIPNADKAIHSANQSGFELIEDKIDFATKYVEQTIRTYLESKFTLKSSLKNGIAGTFKNNLAALGSDAGYLRGIQVKINRNPFYSFFLSSVSIHGQASGAENIWVYDLLEDRLLDTIAVTTVAKQRVTVDVYKQYDTDGQKLNLFICSDAEVYKSNLSGSCCTSNAYVSFAGKKLLSASDKIQDNLEQGNGSSGLSISYSVNCSFEPMLCRLKNQLAMPILFRAGYEILKEMRFSKRLNSVVTLYSDDHDSLMEMYDAEFRQQIGQIVENLDMSNACFRCRKQARQEVALP